MRVQGLGVRNFPEATYDVESIYQQESIDSLFASIKAEASALSSAQFTSRYLMLYTEHLKGTFCRLCHAPIYIAHCLVTICGLVVLSWLNSYSIVLGLHMDR